jgi:hypothetical protein
MKNTQLMLLVSSGVADTPLDNQQRNGIATHKAEHPFDNQQRNGGHALQESKTSLFVFYRPE